MYAWLWHRLPFGLRGKIASAVVVVVGVGLLLWYVVFPAVEPILPFYDVQVSSDGGAGGDVPAQNAPGGPAASPSPAGGPAATATGGPAATSAGTRTAKPTVTIATPSRSR